jgi:hypothetical protein
VASTFACGTYNDDDEEEEDTDEDNGCCGTALLLLVYMNGFSRFSFAWISFFPGLFSTCWRGSFESVLGLEARRVVVVVVVVVVEDDADADAEDEDEDERFVFSDDFWRETLEDGLKPDGSTIGMTSLKSRNASSIAKFSEKILSRRRASILVRRGAVNKDDDNDDDDDGDNNTSLSSCHVSSMYSSYGNAYV